MMYSVTQQNRGIFKRDIEGLIEHMFYLKLSAGYIIQLNKTAVE